MHKLFGRLGILLALLLAACAGYTQMGMKTVSHQNSQGGDLTVRIKKANGSAGQAIEVNSSVVQMLEADVTLILKKGTFRIELIGDGDRVTLALEARDGETVSGHGQMAVDSFGMASYRVAAFEAENVEYVIRYTFR